ncbi:MAG: haloacid dehalogenase type II [Chloroflexi bacterium]|nr:MAG: haloacid dehalogenase type II [Chloroflexota bacterium]
MADLTRTQALTFDLFGTILDLGGSLTPYIADFLAGKGATVTAETFWAQWRERQRLEQFQDTLMMLGHSGYLETARRAFVYTLARNAIEATPQEVADLMAAWQHLRPFSDVVPALERLGSRFKLVVLSNGEPDFLEHLATNQVCCDFDAVISVNLVGAFKPHPAVYRRAARELGLEVGECLMVSSNSFDVVGARACGMRGAYVNRYRLPYEETPYQPDLTVSDFSALADALLK